MPTPRKNEKKSDFVSRCIPIVLKDGTAKDQKQAAAICYHIWREKKKKKSKAAAPSPEVRANAPKEGDTLSLCTGSLEIEAEAPAPEHGTKRKARRFTMNAYNGGPMRVGYYCNPVVVDLSGVSGADKTRPAFLNHDPTKIVGHIDKIEIKDNSINASGVISGAGDAAAEVCATSDNGFPWQASIGASVLNMEYVEEGSSAKANGKTFDGPISIARKCVLGEISFVPLGADDSTSARVAATAAKGSPMNFEQWLEAMGFKLADLNDAQRNSLKAKFDAETLAASKKDDMECDAADGDDDADSEEDADDDNDGAKAKAGKKAEAGAKLDIAASIDVAAIADKARKAAQKAVREEHANEAKRIAAIGKICAGRHAEIQAQAIEEGWDLTKTELEVLRAERKGADSSSGGGTSVFGINTGKGAQVTTEVIAASAALSAGVSEKRALDGLNDQQKNMAVDAKLRRNTSSIYGLCAMVLAANGVPIPSARVDEKLLEATFRVEKRLEITADAGFSTMSLSGITENILNKALLDAYGNVPSAVPDIAYETDTPDFKQFKRYRLTASGLFKALGAAGELSNFSLQDESYANQVKTAGVILTIGREILINDDMGALTQAPTLLGRGAALYRESQVFTTLVGNASSFFGTGNKNYKSGAGSALSISSVTTAVQALREQKDANNQPIMVQPDRMLVPPALETTADTLFNGANLVVGALGSTSSKSVEPNLNAHKGKYRPIVSPYLGANSPTSGSTDTGWYLLTNPAGGFAVVQVGYLRGQRVPIIERGEANFNQLGIAMRCYYDFGVALHDFRCGVLSAGV